MSADLDDILRRLEALEVLARGLSKKREISENIRIMLSIYMFRNIFSPFDVNWIFRVREEEIAFKLFKKSKLGDILPHFLNLKHVNKHPQVFLAELSFKGKIKPAIIRVPKLYPYLPPNSIVTMDKSLEIYTSHTNQEKCLGDIVKGRWDDRGRMGIAHWLLFVETYLSLRERKLKI